MANEQDKRIAANASRWMKDNDHLQVRLKVCTLAGGQRIIVVVADGKDEPFFCFPISACLGIISDMKLCARLAAMEDEREALLAVLEGRVPGLFIGDHLSTSRLSEGEGTDS